MNDPIQAVNAICDELLRTHGELLRHKNICYKHDFIRAIKLDLDKLTHALFEVRDTPASAVLDMFFGPGSNTAKEVLPLLAGPDVYHVGFEIHEPLDLVLYGINHWMEQSKRKLGADMCIREYLRFPASAAFVKRVNAPTEIMRIWLQVSGRHLMLELFDLRRPADELIARAPRPAHRNFDGLVQQEDGFLPGHGERLSRLFSDDEIWHYALEVQTPEQVRAAHEAGLRLAAEDVRYYLPYDAPVYNAGDGSLHTKIVRSKNGVAERMELEIVTHLKPQEAQPE